METWKPCPCCQGENPEHALWEVTDTSTGDVLRVKVPWSSRAEHYGWGERPHVRWKGADGAPRYGLEQARGDRGITALDTAGNVVRLPHGQFTEHGKAAGLATPPSVNQRTVEALRKAAMAELEPLRKARELKAGQRWITVHPNGPDEKGVPVLIQQEPDGTHRIVAGAGGKLTHLRLTGVKSEEEYAAGAADKAKERREKEKQRKAAQGDEAAKKEKQAKKDVEAAKLLAERAFIQKVRERVGGVAHDLDEDKLKGLSTGAQSLILTRHHKKQLREADAAVQALSKKLVEEHVSQAIESEAVKRAVEEDPVVAPAARELAQMELDLKAQEDEERRAERRANQLRTTSGDSKVGERAAQAIIESVEKAHDPKSELDRLGGRDDDASASFLRNTLLPSEEIERRAAQSMHDAKVLAKVAKGEKPESPAEQKIVEKVLQKAGVEDLGDPEEVKQAALAEAARAARRAEIQRARAKRFKELEADKEEGGEEAAERALTYADMLGGIASSAAAAKAMGLTEAERVPMQEPEIAAALDVLQERQVLRKKVQEFQAINKEAENGKYDRSRRAFELNVDPNPEKVALSVQEEVQRELTERLLGMVSRKRSEHLQALSAGHYDALADVGLGVAGQRFVDRPTVDAIGVGNAALLMRHAMEAEGHQAKPVLAALESHHVEQLTKLTADAIDKADRYVPGMKTAVEGVDDIEKALHQLDAHEADVGDAQRALGSALGRMEATATLAQAFRRALPESMTVKAQSGEFQTALSWLHAVGLRPEDYAIDYKAGEIQIPRRSWDKMVNRIPAEEVQRRKVANDIKAGRQDEEGYLPPGIVRRAASTFTAPAPEAPRYHVPMDHTRGDLRAALEDHVGSRLADGEQPHEILHDLLATVNVNAARDPEAYSNHVRDLFPLLDAEGKQVKYDQHAGHFQRVAEDFMRRKYGDAAGAFHAQDLGVDDPETHEALFRALAKTPEAVAAFTPTGQLSHEHARVLRDHFYARMGIDPKEKADGATFQRELAEIGPEPSETAGTLSLFGHAGPTPEYREWAAKRDAILARHPRAGLDEAIRAAKGDPEKIEAAKRAAAEATTPWERYVETHGSLELAQRALQDELRGKFVRDFAEHYGKVTGRGLKVGVAEVTNRERHVKATASPEEADALRRRAQETYAKLRQRVGGRFAGEGEGALLGKFTRHLEESTIQEQNQLSMFGARPPAPDAPKAKEPGLGERHTLGERAESQIASLMPSIGAQFEPGRPVGLFPGLNMDGPRVHQQRVIKMQQANGGRLAAFLGTGSGKSLTSIGAFTEAHARGQAQHGLYLVPSAVQDQFGAEMLRYTEPGKYRWATGSGKSHAERVAMLKDPSLHMRVMTHQSFRDTALKLMAEHHGRSEEQMKADLAKATPQVRADWMRQAFDAQGIPRHFVYLDEAHMATNRGGEDPSGIHMVMQAASHPANATHALFGTATPHKNDESEVYSMASMVDPQRYADQHEFMQAFGQDLAFNPDAVRRELSHLTYSARVDPEGVDRIDTDNPRIEAGAGGLFGGGAPRKVAGGGPIKLEGEHKALVDRAGAMYERARKARDKGQVDVEAVRELSPTRFEGRPDSEHEAIARELLPSLGILKEAAMRRAVNGAPPEINQKLQQLTSVVRHDLDHGEWTDRQGNTQKGKPSIIFTDRLSEARMIHDHLAAQGVRVGLYHGGLNAQERESVRLGFQPEGGGAPKHDVVVATSAAEAGINMQRAKVIHHYDVPQTEKSHAQRSGRAYRQGQQGDVDVHNWHTDAEYEQAGLRRLRRKEGLASVFQTPIANLDETGIALHYHKALANQHQHREVA